MEGRPAPAAPGLRARSSSQLAWYWTLSPPGQAAFWAPAPPADLWTEVLEAGLSAS